jgi:hypothetical protein
MRMTLAGVNQDEGRDAKQQMQPEVMLCRADNKTWCWASRGAGVFTAAALAASMGLDQPCQPTSHVT